MNVERTTRWWVVRLELLIGVGVTLLGGLGFVLLPSSGSMFGVEPRIDIGPLDVPMSPFVPLVALAVAVVGLIWMARIFRGPRDDPSFRRYRDH